jgi:hypothetical protein
MSGGQGRAIARERHADNPATAIRRQHFLDTLTHLAKDYTAIIATGGQPPTVWGKCDRLDSVRMLRGDGPRGRYSVCRSLLDRTDDECHDESQQKTYLEQAEHGQPNRMTSTRG